MDEIALLGGIGSTSIGDARGRWLRVQGAWSLAVGGHVKKVTRPCSLRHDTLSVEVRDRAWMDELEKLAPRIAERLRDLLPSEPLRKIVFRLGPARHDAFRTGGSELPAHRETPGKPGSAGQMRGSLDKVGDERLRDRLEHLIDRYLERGQAAG